MNAMKLLAWNLRDGGETKWKSIRDGRERLSRVMGAIVSHAPDVILLTEYRSAPGDTIRRELEDKGWTWCQTANPTGTTNGVCVLSRTPVSVRPGQRFGIKRPERWLEVDLPDHGVNLVGVHIPCSSKKTPGSLEEKTAFWHALLQAASERRDGSSLLIGDFNTGIPKLDEPGNTFDCVEDFLSLDRMGWKDAWRHLHGDRREFSWFGKKGYRIDHAFLTPALLPRLRACYYSHEEREADISDHSPMLLELD